MENLSLIEEENRYWNWYQGYSLLGLPFYDEATKKLVYKQYSYSSAAKYKTPQFGGPFDAEQVENWANCFKWHCAGPPILFIHHIKYRF